MTSDGTNEVHMMQLDGNDTVTSSIINSDDSKNNTDDTQNETDDSQYDTDDEPEPGPRQPNLFPIPGQNVSPGVPLQFDVDLDDDIPSCLPLCLMMNARSVYNKSDNLKEMLNRISPSFVLISETWERERQKLETVLNSRMFKTFSYYRKNKSPGGGCAIVCNTTENQFDFRDADIDVPENVEAVWAICTPVSADQQMKVKRIAIGSIYVSPRSKHKSDIIDHIIDSIHLLRAKYNNEINFCIGGDFNHLDVNEILECYGGLRQIISVPTRKSATLEIMLTDMHTLYHPPTTIPPLQVDTGKKGKDSDYEVVIFAPISNIQYKVHRKKKTIRSRPIPDSQVLKFENEVAKFQWDEELENLSVDEQTEVFHNFLQSNLEKLFPEKSVKISYLDQAWMSPELKNLHRRMQREFYRKRKSKKYKSLKSKFKKLKRKSVKKFHSEFISELKTSNPGKWYQLAKKIGTHSQARDGDIIVESLSELNNLQATQKIAEHFASISNEYSPIDNTQLPSYLPALPPPQVKEYDVYLRLKHLKKTKSTLPLDIPDKIRQECAVLLAGPLSTIINTSLNQSLYPRLWKQEWVTPVPKISHPIQIKDLRKISGTSDYSKVYEGFLKDWIMEDIADKIDIGQYGGQPGIGTEHMIVCMVDRILKLLDEHRDRSAVIMTSLDWSAAFDRQDPTLAIKKFLQLGVRPSLIPLLSSYLSDRTMRVKFNGELSEWFSLIGGGPQGTLLGQTEYLVQSNDNADNVAQEDRFKYIDDLSVLQLLLLSGLLVEYDFHSHVASDVGIGQTYLPPNNFETQECLNTISRWTDDNLMKLNAAKCEYMVFSRSEENFATRLAINGTNLDRVHVSKILGVWISDDLSWSRNSAEICKQAYSRLSMITRLKYVGAKTEDLLDIYILYIRSVTEYCSTVFHSRLTDADSDKIERIQKTCLKVILDVMYIDYNSALEMTGLATLKNRRLKRCLDFSLKSIKHPRNSRMFPPSETNPAYRIRNSEWFKVNFAHTSAYKDSTIPFCQRLLNDHVFKKK